MVLNLGDQFNSNNNAGFNLTNFKVKFINQFFHDVITDYEKSIIGTFTKHLLDYLAQEPFKDLYDLYFTITKFENDIGYSLIHQDTSQTEGGEVQVQAEEQVIRQNDLNPSNVIQEVVGEKGKKLAKEDFAKAYRKAQLNRHGVIPEFIKISEIYQVYTAFTQANLKNSILQQKQARMAETFEEEQEAVRESELKEDVILIQFKLVDKRSFKCLNTFSFVNLPFSKVLDVNVSTLLEILNKFKKHPEKQGKARKQGEFIPYNKSIMTRVVAEQLQKNNILVLSHFSRNSI